MKALKKALAKSPSQRAGASLTKGSSLKQAADPTAATVQAPQREDDVGRVAAKDQGAPPPAAAVTPEPAAEAAPAQEPALEPEPEPEPEPAAAAPEAAAAEAEAEIEPEQQPEAPAAEAEAEEEAGGEAEEEGAEPEAPEAAAAAPAAAAAAAAAEAADAKVSAFAAATYQDAHDAPAAARGGDAHNGGGWPMAPLGALLALVFAAFLAWHAQLSHGSVDWHPQWGSGSLVRWGGGEVKLFDGAPVWPPRMGNSLGLAFPLTIGSGALSKVEIDGYMAALEKLPMPAGDLKAFLPRVRAWAQADDGRPVYMINLVQDLQKIKKLPGAPAFDGTPEEATRRYRGGALALLLRRASYPVFSGAAQARPLAKGAGGGAADWSRALVVRYPSRRAFLRMLADPAYAPLMPYKLMSQEFDLLPVSGELSVPELPWLVGGGLLAVFLAVGWMRASARAARLAA